jgi:hypothetical protein
MELSSPDNELMLLQFSKEELLQENEQEEDNEEEKE